MQYLEYISGNELLMTPLELEAVVNSTISLQTTDVKPRKLIGFSKKIMEKAPQSLNPAAKILAKRSNDKWDILLAIENDAKIWREVSSP